MPKEKSLTVATDSFKMTQLTDFTGSRNSVVMDNITEHWSPQGSYSKAMNTAPKSDYYLNYASIQQQFSGRI